MSSAWIRTRKTKSGNRWQVLYRRGGRAFRIETAGTFRTQKDARTRLQLVSGWLAAGLHPADELARIAAAQRPRLTVAQALDRYAGSRLDHAESTARGVVSAVKKLSAMPVANVPAAELTFQQVQETVNTLAATLSPQTVRRYITTLKIALDHADIRPNPARDDRIRLPVNKTEEATPPTADQFLRMLNAMPSRWWLPTIVIEQTAMRIGEAAGLTWGDVDEAGSRFRLRAEATKTRRARWVQLPPWLMGAVASTVAREDRTETRLVFPGLQGSALKHAMARACVTAGVPHFHPHDLRHRRLSLWFLDNVPDVIIAQRAGHSKVSMTKEVYAHVMPVDEVAAVDLERMVAL